MLTYNQAKALFESARDKAKGKPIDNNTRIVKTTKGYGVKLHNTVIVDIDENNNYTINNGGWYSPTTKDRINKYSPIRVYQQKNVWYFTNSDSFGLYNSNGSRLLYANGITFNSNGAIVSNHVISNTAGIAG